MPDPSPAPPRWTLEPAQLDALELLASGLCARPVFGPADPADPLRPELLVDASTAVEAAQSGALELRDAEGILLATVHVTGTTTQVAGDRTGIDGPVTVHARPARTDAIAARRELPTRVADRLRDGRARLGHLTYRSLHGPDIAALAAAARAHAPDAPQLLLVLAVTAEDQRLALQRAVRRALEQLPDDVGVDLDVVQLPPAPVELGGERDHALLLRLGATATTVPRPPGVQPPPVALDADASRQGAALAASIRAGDELTVTQREAALPEVVAALRPAYPLRRDRGAVLLFTGLPGSGKSTIARAVRDRLVATTGRPVTLLDGDLVRQHLSSGLTFSREDRDRNVARIGFVAAEIARHGGLALCAPIAPFDAVRRQVRAMVEGAGAGFRLVHVATPLAVCEARDPKGLYARARAGHLTGLTGVDDPYELPTDAEVVLDTAEVSLAGAVQLVVDSLAEGGWWADPTVLRSGGADGDGQ
ncbi:MAG: adenylyl-sulfate kinase [Nitriliruptor sp.]|nr:MAG: adenylyl-sulfate kinase [Nitriliruptor sp.]